MKNIALVVGAFTVLAATGCKNCKECTVSQSDNGVLKNKTVRDVCGDNLKEVDGKTIVTTQFVDNDIYYVTLKYDCK